MCKKLILMMSLIVFSSLLFSCSTGTTTGQTEAPNYRTGSQALEMRLLNPATEDFYEGEKVEILVEYFNRGTSDIVNGEFFVSGYDLQFMNFALSPKVFSIEGKDEFDPEGANSDILEIESQSGVKLPVNSDEFTQSIKLIGCYDYKTLATAELCIDPDPYNRRVTQKICNMGIVSPGGQGAPVVVTSVEPIVKKNDLRLNIQIANQGGGLLYDRDLSNEDCFLDLDKYEDLNKVDLLKVDFSGHRMSCSPSNPIRMVNGVAKISCECKDCLSTYADAYKTQISIELEYGYRNEIVKNIRILKD